MRQIKRPVEAFARFSDWFQFLDSKRFEPKLCNDTSFEDWEKRWANLVGPTPLDFANQLDRPAAHFSYAAGDASFKDIELGLLFVSYEQPIDPPAFAIRVRSPEAAMDLLVSKTLLEDWSGQSQSLPSHVRAEPGVIIGPDCEFGSGVILESGVRIGRNVRIGAGTRVGAYTDVRDFTEIGADCQIGSHSVLGSLGFGLVVYPGERVPRQKQHAGAVKIGSQVRMGSFVSIDRGVLFDTIVGDGCCFDNHVQVAHNCRIGNASVFCSFVGLSGSTEVGAGCTLAGMVGTKGHIRIGDRVRIGGQSGVSKDIPDGLEVKGYPARPLAEALKIQTLVTKLPELYARLRKLEKGS